MLPPANPHSPPYSPTRLYRQPLREPSPSSPTNNKARITYDRGQTYYGQTNVFGVPHGRGILSTTVLDETNSIETGSLDGLFQDGALLFGDFTLTHYIGHLPITSIFRLERIQDEYIFTNSKTDTSLDPEDPAIASLQTLLVDTKPVLNSPRWIENLVI